VYDRGFFGHPTFQTLATNRSLREWSALFDVRNTLAALTTIRVSGRGCPVTEFMDAPEQRPLSTNAGLAN
jgi:hypothetical protein